jgi:hypothetical protein
VSFPVDFVSAPMGIVSVPEVFHSLNSCKPHESAIAGFGFHARAVLAILLYEHPRIFHLKLMRDDVAGELWNLLRD